MSDAADDEETRIERLRARLATRRRHEFDAAAHGLDGMLRPAAVLLPVVTEAERPLSLIFIKRHAGLTNHAGQIAFPGGKRDDGDADAAATALRETREELGIDERAVEVLGLLDDIPTPTGFLVTPVVGRVRGPVAFTPATSEVAAVFVHPVDELLAPGCYRNDGVRSFLGLEYVMHEFHFAEHRMWGATAVMTYELLHLLK
jgi:8-oxo-dGTP pyrophosphatase MutT (NUDIX family)